MRSSLDFFSDFRTIRWFFNDLVTLRPTRLPSRCASDDHGRERSGDAPARAKRVTNEKSHPANVAQERGAHKRGKEARRDERLLFRMSARAQWQRNGGDLRVAFNAYRVYIVNNRIGYYFFTVLPRVLRRRAALIRRCFRATCLTRGSLLKSGAPGAIESQCTRRGA